MPYPKENESAKIQGDKLESAVDRVAPDRSDRPREQPQNQETDKVERERKTDDDEA